jgi:hypothetical protein
MRRRTGEVRAPPEMARLLLGEVLAQVSPGVREALSSNLRMHPGILSARRKEFGEDTPKAPRPESAPLAKARRRPWDDGGAFHRLRRDALSTGVPDTSSTRLLLLLVAPASAQEVHCDVSGSGAVSTLDALLLAQLSVAGL